MSINLLSAAPKPSDMWPKLHTALKKETFAIDDGTKAKAIYVISVSEPLIYSLQYAFYTSTSKSQRD